ncbi:MAG UNVERIFIED_CONTAM: hypothetical protein LVR29_20515 [Microcystis novacekii LVE1205-3]
MHNNDQQSPQSPNNNINEPTMHIFRDWPFPEEHKRQADQLDHDRKTFGRNHKLDHDEEEPKKVPATGSTPKLASTTKTTTTTTTSTKTTTTTTTAKAIKEQLTRLDHRRDSEQLRHEKQVLLNQIRTKQTAGLQKVTLLPNVEQEETEKMNMHPEDHKGTFRSFPLDHEHAHDYYMNLCTHGTHIVFSHLCCEQP